MLGNRLFVEGDLDAAPNETFDVELFGVAVANVSGHGGANALLATTEVRTNDHGLGSFSIEIDAVDETFASVTSTATNRLTNDTSEFSRNRIINRLSFRVNSTEDPLHVDESGRQSILTVQLSGRPRGNVTLRATPSDPSEVHVESATIVVSPDNWQTPQQVTVRGVDDPLIDGEIDSEVIISVIAAPLDAGLESWEFSPVRVRTHDDDVARLVIEESSGTTRISEIGDPQSTQDDIFIRLSAQPKFDCRSISQPRGARSV